MKALVIEKDTLASSQASAVLKEVPDPVLDDSEALVKIRMAGICQTNQELAKGYMDFSGIPGHEFVGEVLELHESCANTLDDLVGTRVVAEINFGCGYCEFCETGMQRHCPDRTVLGIKGKDGIFAEYATLPVENLHIVPDNMDDYTAVFTEPVAAALEPLEQVQIKPNSMVMVIGDGKLGLLIARVLQIHGCHVSCYGGSRKKLELLRSWGVDAVHYDEFEAAPYFDYVVEASGVPQGFKMAMQSVIARGTIILKSTYAGSLTLDTAPLVINEVTVVGSRCGEFGPALNLLQQGLIPVKNLISKVYKFDEAEAAFKHATEPDALKVLMQFD